LTLDVPLALRPECLNDDSWSEDMPRRAALLALMLTGLSGCGYSNSPTDYAAQQYHHAIPKFLVFFSPWSSTLDAAGLKAASSAAAAAQADPNAKVNVIGFASTVGPEAANMDLARNRAAVVEAQLVADGVSGDRVVTMSRGATTYQFTPQEARRVEIDIVHAGF
jgi:outer membrane protein OmpA-like peptidoglycan-associated protein